jgi:hypothetical protein
VRRRRAVPFDQEVDQNVGIDENQGQTAIRALR